MKKIQKGSKETAKTFEMGTCAKRALDIYVTLTTNHGFSRRANEEGFWTNMIHSIQAQWGTAKNLTLATEAFMSPTPNMSPSKALVGGPVQK